MPKTSQAKKVYDYVIRQIKLGRWNPGDQIMTEMELCEELDVSRIAVREALGQCSALGVLEKRKGSGTYVCEINISNILKNIIPLMTLNRLDLMDVLKFRLSFESGNVIEFVQHCTQEDIAELEQTYAEMTGRKLDASFYTADYKFHEIIARGTKNPLVIAVNEMLTGVLLSSQELTNLAVGPEIGLSFHKDIINAIKNRDSQMAALLMTRHIEATIAAVELTNDKAE
ncbi:MAG: FadR family transcriptional regulator [Eubacteriales bacterium]|nr:FadR family transcriptional regulator [Eubacteriales bacterium]